LAIVTGASSGIGLELAHCCAEQGMDLLIAADEPQIEDAAAALRQHGVDVEWMQADLATPQGVDRLCDATYGQSVDYLLANAGHGLGGAFLDQPFEQSEHVIATNVTGTIRLVHNIGRVMRESGHGRILITGSIAGYIPGSFSAVYNGTKAFIDSFAAALRNELKHTEITVTCLMPGPTETEFFERAGMLDTKMGRRKKDSATDVARVGFEAMMKGEADVVSGFKNKLESVMANVTPSGVLAERHRKLAEPGSGEEK
jgi:short-subunit dehydrogenase